MWYHWIWLVNLFLEIFSLQGGVGEWHKLTQIYFWCDRITEAFKEEKHHADFFPFFSCILYRLISHGFCTCISKYLYATIFVKSHCIFFTDICSYTWIFFYLPVFIRTPPYYLYIFIHFIFDDFFLRFFVIIWST